MAYDEVLADRVRALIHAERGVSEMRMFGGLAFLINGTMVVSASGQGGLLLRVDPATSAELSTDPAVRPFVMRGRELAGWLHIDPAAVTTDDQLSSWVALGVSYVRSLAPRTSPG